MAEEIKQLMNHLSAQIYAGIAVVFLVVYTTLAVHEYFTGSNLWVLYFLVLGFGLFLLFFATSGRMMKRVMKMSV